MANVRNSELWTRRNLLRAAGGMLALATTGTLAACGGADAKSPTVKMTTEMRFEPAVLTIKVGETVTWKNTGTMVHTVTTDPTAIRDHELVQVPEGAETWDSGLINQEKSWSHTFTVAGTYKYVCVPHLLAGMMGEIVVEA
jgi:plastocyanin